jgi:hypothetical protein
MKIGTQIRRAAEKIADARSASFKFSVTSAALIAKKSSAALRLCVNTF